MTDQPFFLTQNPGFLQAQPSDELLHREENAKVKGDSLTETQYFGFNVPAAGIHGLAYLWHHPNLKVVTGGVMSWKGVKRMSVAAELFDFRAYMNDSAISNDLHEYRLDNGYGVKIIEPNKRFHVTYRDDVRGNLVDLHCEGVTPIVMFGDGKHMEQGMRVTGKLMLRGESFDVDCFNIRDKSWGKLRPEDITSAPPVSWMTGVFDENLMFNCNLMDHAGSSADCIGKFAVPPEKALNGGWIWKNGKLQRIVSATKIVERNNGDFTPRKIELAMTDEGGETLKVSGRLVATCPWGVWPNIMAHISLMEWEMDGRKAYGDCQDILWNDFVVHATR